jgi:hypothetical protein
MSRACNTNGEKMNAYRILLEKAEGKKPIGRPRPEGKALRHEGV